MEKYIKNVCFVENLYTLLLYLLTQEENVLDNTFFFFTSKVPEKIRKRCPFHECMEYPKSDYFRLFYVLWLRFIKRWKYPFLDTAELFGQDNLTFTSPLVGKRKLTLLEDGVINYSLSAARTCGWLKGLIGGEIMKQPPFGMSNSVNKILLTGLGNIPKEIQNKVEIINPNILWKNSSARKQQRIICLFGLSDTIIESFKKSKSVLFTQPLSEDGVIDEETKISIYNNIIKSDCSTSIKPHPRETTNYKPIFPNNTILEPNIPIELLTLLGIKFETSYTIFSTAVLSFPYPTDVHFLGTCIHPKLVEKFGDIKYENGHITRKIVK